ncbi:MAG: RNase III inhibitor [Ponticaulis sp.]|nr:RNase III inhibitor [Ponticaulis sp.]
MLTFYQGSLLDLEVDAIVNAANSSLMGGGGVDGVIHRAAGPELKEACRPLAPCPPGEVRVTEGFGLAPRLIFHTVGPIWRGGLEHEDAVLEACYWNCLEEARDRSLKSLAFPAISTGAYGFPTDRAANIAVNTCKVFAKDNELDIWLVAIDRKNILALENLL